MLFLNQFQTRVSLLIEMRYILLQILYKPFQKVDIGIALYPKHQYGKQRQKYRRKRRDEHGNNAVYYLNSSNLKS